MTIQVGKVAMISQSSIIVGERAREVMGDLDGLESNMKESGLISPLAVRDNKDGTFLLLAGERRFTILQRNNTELIPVRVYEDSLSDLEIKVIEKSENFFRKDMEYYEFDRLTMEIHRMQQELHGVASQGTRSDLGQTREAGWSATDTAGMIGAATKKTVLDSIKRAQAREAFPQLFEGCKSASDASKVLQKVDEAVVRQAIAQRLEAQQTDGTLGTLSSQYIVKDFFEGVKDIPDGVIHLVEIDPPYGIDLAKQKKKDGESQYQLDEYNEIDKADYPAFLLNVFKECYRVMTPNSWLICWFGPQPWFEVVYQSLLMSGFESTRMCGVWTKGTPGQNMNPQTRLSNAYEMFFYAWKGTPVLNKAGHGNEFHFSPVPPGQKTHPTERPLDLMKELYDTFAFPGARVLIPFLGSGSGLLAASELGLTASGFELSKAYKDSFLVKVHVKYGKG